MKKVKILLKISLIVIVAIVISCSARSKSPKNGDKSAEDKWIQLFNGKDLNDWDIKFKGHPLGENYKNTFRVEDGMLRVRYDDWEEFGNVFGHIFYRGEFSHYRLRVEYRFVGNQVKGGPGWAFRNNGLMLHGQSAASMELDQDFPVSMEIQLLGGDGTNERSTLNLCTPGTNVVMDGKLIEQHCNNSRSKTFHGDQWVTAEVEVHGGETIRHYVNGEEVMHYEKPQLDPRDKYYLKFLPADSSKIITKGSISLQAESHNTDFRKIELMILDQK